MNNSGGKFSASWSSVNPSLGMVDYSGSLILLSTFSAGQEEVVVSSLKFDSQNTPANLEWTFHLTEM